MTEQVDREQVRESECYCQQQGQPMTPFGVQHLEGCAWVKWWLSEGGCQGDV